MLAYQAPSPQEQTPVRRRLSGFALALGINLLLLMVLLTLGIIPPPGKKDSSPLVVELVPDSHSAAPRRTPSPSKARPTHPAVSKTFPKPPALVLPSKPTIAQPAPKSPWIEMSHDELASADITNLPKSGDGAGSGDSEEVGRAPNGEVLYAAQWARRPTSAEVNGYRPANAPEGWGLVACKTIPDDRVEDCVELGQSPLGSHLASAVRQAAWQFRVRPPRKNGRALIGSWVQIRIEWYGSGDSSPR